jgi:hypothetical protein
MLAVVALVAVVGAVVLRPVDAVRAAEPSRNSTVAALPDTSDDLERKIWNLLDNEKVPFVSLSEADFRALGQGFDLPDGGKNVTDLALKAPGGAFDPRDLAKISSEKLGYRADWIVERYRRYNLDWDITGLRLTSLNPEAAKFPWFIIINGGAANLYEFVVDLKNQPGWAQYLAQKINVMVVSIPGNFKYGGWTEPIESPKRYHAYLLDRELPTTEIDVRNIVLTNAVILQGLKALIMKHTKGDVLIVGHSTSGELAFLANEDPDLRLRLNGRFFGWGSSGPARLVRVREVKNQRNASEGRRTQTGTGARRPLEVLSRRNPEFQSRTYSGFLNPLYEAGMSRLQIAERWLEAEGRRRPNIKQQIQDLEHGARIEEKGRVEVELFDMLKKTGNPWGVDLEDVNKDLFSSHYTRLDGYKQMVWTVAHFDASHWGIDDPMTALELYVANEFRARNSNARIRVMVWDPPLTHYGHVEMPKQLAAGTYSVIRWFFK